MPTGHWKTFSDRPGFWTRAGEWQRTNNFAFSEPASFTESPNGEYGRGLRDTVILHPRILDKEQLRVSFRVAAFVEARDTAALLVSYGSLDAPEQQLAWWNDSQDERWKDTTKGPDAWRWGSVVISGEVGDTAFLKLSFRSNVIGFSDGFYIDDITIDDLVSVEEADDIVLGVYPQPATTFMNVGLASDMPVKITLFDLSGSEMSVTTGAVRTDWCDRCSRT